MAELVPKGLPSGKKIVVEGKSIGRTIELGVILCRGVTDFLKEVASVEI